jgi:hypothetical protein
VKFYPFGGRRRSAGVGFGEGQGDDVLRPDAGGRIEGIESDAIVVQIPRTGGTLPDVGAQVHMTIDAAPGFECCEVRVLGRWERNEGGARHGGVRVSIPTVLEHVQRRQCHRLTVAFDLSPTAEAFHIGPEGETQLGRGDILDVSEAGVRLRLRLRHTLLVGERLRIAATFPEPPSRAPTPPSRWCT